MKFSYAPFLTMLTLAGNPVEAEIPGNLKRVNILFVFADDWGRYASCYKEADGRPTLNDVIRTPHVDRVAGEGIVFRNAYVNAPSCTPCRSSLLSGRYFFNCNQGAILNGAVWDESIPSYPLMLRDAGYTIGKSYKVWSPGTPVDAPFGGQKYAFEKAGRAPNNYSEEVTGRLNKGMTLEEARNEILGQVRENFRDFLSSTEKGKPWHYFFGPTTTHRVWIKGSGKKLWNIDPESLKGKLPRFLPDVPEVREDVADYLGECQAVDAYIGVLLECLELAGEQENTLIVLSGDHGMPGVTSGKCNLYDMGVTIPLIIKVPGKKNKRVVDDFVRLPDLAPTFMEIAGITPSRNLYGRSLIPLLLSEKNGRIDPSRDWVITGRERHVSTARENNLPYPMRAFHTPEYVYIRNFEPERWPMGSPGKVNQASAPEQTELENTTRAAFADMDASPTKAWIIQHRAEAQWIWFYNIAFGKRPAEELYDRNNDPDMVNNLAESPRYAAVKKKLAGRLMKELKKAGDPRVTENPPRFERPPFTLP